MPTLLVITLLTFGLSQGEKHPAKNQPGQQAHPTFVQPMVGSQTRPIRVVEMPPKDALDRWSFAATMALAIVGVFGIRVAVGSG